MKLFRNKKGFLADKLYLGIIFFILAIVVIVLFNLLSEFKDQSDKNDLFSGVSQNILDEKVEAFPILYDTVMITFIVGICLTNLVASFVIRTHPIFFIISLLMLLVFAIPFSVFSNIFEDVSSTNALTTTTASFNWLPYIMDKFPLWMVVINIIVAIAVYSKGD